MAKNFQFTTSQGGRLSPGQPRPIMSIFQFTTSQGGRPRSTPIAFPISIFQFTTSQGGRLSGASASGLRFSFQFTTSQGGRRALIYSWPFCRSFNSRPHKEVDVNNLCYFCSSFLSIHDLTRRSTTPRCCGRRRSGLSIHDLTRRSTFLTF